MKDYLVIEALTKSDLFGSLTETEKVDIIAHQSYRIKDYTKKQVIHMQSEICGTLDLIIRGEVAVQRIDENGNVLTIDTLSPFDVLGANLLFATVNKYPMTVSANTNVVMMHISKGAIFDLCKVNHAFLKALLQAVSEKTLLLTAKIQQVFLQTIRQRITRYLDIQWSIQGTDIIQLTLSKKQLSEKFGIPRSSLGRELQKMRADGLITYDAKSITIINLQK